MNNIEKIARYLTNESEKYLQKKGASIPNYGSYYPNAWVYSEGEIKSFAVKLLNKMKDITKEDKTRIQRYIVNNSVSNNFSVNYFKEPYCVYCGSTNNTNKCLICGKENANNYYTLIEYFDGINSRYEIIYNKKVIFKPIYMTDAYNYFKANNIEHALFIKK